LSMRVNSGSCGDQRGCGDSPASGSLEGEAEQADHLFRARRATRGLRRPSLDAHGRKS